MIDGSATKVWKSRVRSLARGTANWLLALAVMTWSTVASAQSFGNQAPRPFDIPPQSVSSALLQYSETMNQELMVDDRLTHGKQSQGVSGTYTPEAALAAILAGTGLTFRLTTGGAVTVIEAPAAAPKSPSSSQPAADTPVSVDQKPIKVPEVVVKEVRDRENQAYTVDDTSSAMRIPVSIHDIPRSVEVVTRQVMDDQRVIRFDQALRNVSGVSLDSTQGGRAGSVMIRGFSSSVNVFKNGFRDDDVFGTDATRDIINLERIDVVKGPPSYLYGRSDPGGVINQITKAPLKNPYYSAEMLIGNYGLYRPQFDIGGPLNASKTLTFRFTGLFESAGSYREGVESTRTFLAPTIGWEIGPRTTLKFEGEYLYTRAPIDRGLVAIGSSVASIPIGRFLGDPTLRNDTHSGKATMTLLHDFNDLFKWRTAFRSAVNRTQYSSRESWFLVGDENDGILNLARFEIPQTTQSHILQNELHGNFATGTLKHKSIVGIELGREVRRSSTASDNPGQDTSTPGAFSFINIFNPADRLFLNTPLTTSDDSKEVNNFLGVYFGDHVSLTDTLHLHGGGRFDYYKQNITNFPTVDAPTQTNDSQSDTAFSPSVGLTYQPWKPIALFANYTESFLPQLAGNRNFAGALFDPQRGKAYEGGIKFQFFEGRLRASVAGFRITKTNVLTPDPINGFPNLVATGEQRSQGVEFDIAGKIMPGWDMIANYAYVDARISEDNSFLVGSRVPNSALNQGSLWTTYYIQNGPLKGFGAGLGMYAQSKRNGVPQCQNPDDCQVSFDLPGFVRMDGALYYRKPELFTRTNLLAAVNFTNILDQRHFTGADFREIIYTGAPFTVIGSIKLEYY